VDERKSIRDNITMVLGNLAKYLREWGLKSKLCRTSRWDNDPERLVVKQMLLGLRTARCRDAVWQELQFSYDDADCPTLLIEVMVLQLDKFEAAEEVLGVMATDRSTGEPGSSGGRSGAPGSAESSKARSTAPDYAVAQRLATRTRASVQGKSSISHRVVYVAPPELGSGRAESRKERTATCLVTCCRGGGRLRTKAARVCWRTRSRW